MTFVLGYPIVSDVDVSAGYIGQFSGSAWQTALPVANVQHLSLGVIARSTGTDADMTVDLGASRDVRVAAAVVRNPSSACAVRGVALSAVPIYWDGDPYTMTNVGSPVVTPVQDDVRGAQKGIHLYSVAVTGKRSDALAFTGDGTKAFAWLLRPDWDNSPAQLSLSIYSSTASTYRYRFQVTWNAEDVPPILTNISGSGTTGTPVAVTGVDGRTWWLIQAAANNVVAADANYAIADRYFFGNRWLIAEAWAWDVSAATVITAVTPASIPQARGVTHYVTVLAAAVATTKFRFDLTDPDNADGYLDVARAVVCEGVVPSVNMAFGAKLSVDDHSTTMLTEGGGTVVVEGLKQRTLELVLPDLPEAEAFAWATLQRSADTIGQCVAVFDDGDSVYAMSRRSFVAQFKKLSAIRATSLARYGVPLSFVEVI